jgi:hypothetical protein
LQDIPCEGDGFLLPLLDFLKRHDIHCAMKRGAAKAEKLSRYSPRFCASSGLPTPPYSVAQFFRRRASFTDGQR